MKFQFKVWDHVKKAWPIYKDQFGFLLVLTVITIIIKGVDFRDNIFLAIFINLVGVFLTFVWIKYSLNLVDGQKINPLSKKFLPTLGQFWNLIKTSILLFIIVLAGFILFIAPGLYLAGRLMFSTYISVEKNKGAIESISASWAMTRNNGWRIFWKGFQIALFILLGFVLFVVGALVTYPLGLLAFSMMYRKALSENHEGGIFEKAEEKTEVKEEEKEE